MPNSDNYLKILEKLGEVGQTLGVLSTEVSHLKEDVKESKTKLEAIEQQDIQQNRLLDEHIRGVHATNERLDVEIDIRKKEKELIEKRMSEIDIRLKKAEFVPNLASNLKTALLWLAAVAGAIITILEMTNKL
jgi:arginyl-tRNA synthetase